MSNRVAAFVIGSLFMVFGLASSSFLFSTIVDNDLPWIVHTLLAAWLGWHFPITLKALNNHE